MVKTYTPSIDTHLSFFVVHLRQSQGFVGAVIIPADIGTRELLSASIVPAPSSSWSSVLAVRLPASNIKILKILLETFIRALLPSVQVEKLVLGVTRIAHSSVTVWRDVARGL